MQLTLMSAAEAQLGNLLQAGQTTQIDSFRVAATIGVTTDAVSSGPSGPLLYNGLPSQVRYTVVSEHEVVFVVYLDDTVGGFTIGNLMLYIKAAAIGGPPIPFLWASLPVGAEKDQDNFDAYVVGNNIVLHFACWFPYITKIIDLSTLTPFYAQFPQYADETQIPAAAISEYEQITIDKHTEYDAATIAVRRNKGLEWFGLAFTQALGDPRLGQIDGGVAGSAYGSPSNIVYVVGGDYFAPNDTAPIITGGLAWAVPTDHVIAGNY